MSVHDQIENDNQEEVCESKEIYDDDNMLHTEGPNTNFHDREDSRTKETEDFKQRSLSSGFSEPLTSTDASPNTNFDVGDDPKTKKTEDCKQRQLSSGYSEPFSNTYARPNTNFDDGNDSMIKETEDVEQLSRELSSGFSEPLTSTDARTLSSGLSEVRPRTETRSLSRGFSEELISNDAGSKRNILFCFRILKEELDVVEFIDRFIQDGYFKSNDLEDIMAIPVRYKRVDLFLRKLLRLKPEARENFLKYLTDCNYDYVRKQLEETIPKQIIVHREDIEEGINFLKNHKDVFVEMIEPDVISDYFLQYECFTIDEYEDIITKDTRKKKAERIYDLVLDHEETAYDVLIVALEESRADDLLEILTEKNDKSESKKSTEESSQMKLELRRVKEWESKEMSLALKESKECQLHIKLKGEDIKNVEVQVIHKLDKLEVSVSLNDTVILDKKCMVSSVEKGSIIITLRRCRHDSFQQLFGTSIQDPILQILRHVFLQPAIRKKIHRKALALEVELHYISSKRKDMTWDVIKANFDYLVEELDSFILIKSLEKKGVLTKDDTIELPKRPRRARITSLLKVVQKKRAQIIFLDILKEKRRYVWDHIYGSNHEQSDIDIPSDILIDSYEELAENMSPSLFINTVATIESFKGLSRSQKAKYILQQFLKTDANTRLKFVNSLFVRDQIPKSLLEMKTPPKNILGNDNAKKTKKKKKKRSNLIFAADYVFKEYPAIKADYKQVSQTPRTKTVGATVKDLPGQTSSTVKRKLLHSLNGAVSC